MGGETKPQIGKDLLTYSQLSRHLAEAHFEDQGWSGLPVPVAGLSLVLEPRYKFKALSEFRWTECFDENGVRHALDQEEGATILGPSQYRRVNSWWNDQFRVTIVVVKDHNDRSRFYLTGEDRLAFIIRTLEAAAAWPVEAEQKAQKKLATLISAEMFDTYLLTGHFSEISRRSRLTYLFRRGRPTIVLRQDEEVSSVLCALCLHPIGYYGNTWAGVMCPTDEVIAHLLMMRGSEEKFWANANQHPVDHPAAGV